MNDQVVINLAWCFVLALAIHAIGFYCVVRLFVTGRSVLERREQEPSRIVRFGGEA